MLDAAIVSTDITNLRVLDSKTVPGIRSDHAAIRTTSMSTSYKFTKNQVGKAILRPDYPSIQYDPITNKKFNDEFRLKWDDKTTYKDFKKLMLQTVIETASAPVKIKKAGFNITQTCYSR